VRGIEHRSWLCVQLRDEEGARGRGGVRRIEAPTGGGEEGFTTVEDYFSVRGAHASHSSIAMKRQLRVSPAGLKR
jgi:hypothetical protein